MRKSTLIVILVAGTLVFVGYLYYSASKITPSNIPSEIIKDDVIVEDATEENPGIDFEKPESWMPIAAALAKSSIAAPSKLSVGQSISEAIDFISDLGQWVLNKEHSNVTAESLLKQLTKKYGGFFAKPLPQNNALVQSILKYSKDNNIPETQTWGQIFGYLGGVSPFTNNTRRDMFGNKTKKGPFGNIASFIPFAETREGRFLIETGVMDRVMTHTTNPGVLWVGDDEHPTPYYDKLDGDQYDKYTELAGKNFQTAVGKYMDGLTDDAIWTKHHTRVLPTRGSSFLKSSKNEIVDDVSGLLSKARKEAFDKLFGENKSMEVKILPNGDVVPSKEEKKKSGGGRSKVRSWGGRSGGRSGGS